MICPAWEGILLPIANTSSMCYYLRMQDQRQAGGISGLPEFKLISEYRPSGDQPRAIEQLVEGIETGYKDQVLLGVTGSGKTYTMACVIERLQRPTLVISHNKILAAQLCSEFKEFFPHNAVEYFVSYYDYYQPEA